MKCEKCENKLDNESLFCSNCGGKVSVSEVKDIEFFSISIFKLVSLSFLTLGLFNIYWFYRNWKAVEKFEHKKMYPFWMSIFAIFTCNALLKKVLFYATENGYKKSYNTIFLSTIFIVFTILGNAWGRMDPLKLEEEFLMLIITSFSVLPLIFAQKAINYSNKSLGKLQRNWKFYTGEAIVSIIGFSLFIFLIYSFIPESKEDVIVELVKEAKSSMILPSKIDELTTLKNITAEKDAILYQYTLSGVDQNTLNNKALKDSSVKNVCSDVDIRGILNKDISLKYEYLDTDTNLSYFVEISKYDCINYK